MQFSVEVASSSALDASLPKASEPSEHDMQPTPISPAGGSEGQLPLRPLDAQRRVLEASKRPQKKALDWAANANHSAPMTYAALFSSLDTVKGSPGLILSVSHDDYHVAVGGVQALIMDERSAFEREGWKYLHISPASPLPIIAVESQTYRVALRLGAVHLGVAQFTDLMRVIAILRDRQVRVELVIHHFMGHVPELLLKLAQLNGDSPIVWLHDFFLLCPIYTLMRNEVKYCAAPEPESSACGICICSADRPAHLRRIRRFFEASQPRVLAPSKVTLDLWQRRGALPCSEATVLPYARLIMSQDDSLKVAVDHRRPLRVAHLGQHAFHKGWTVFEELAIRHRDDHRYTFYQLGLAHGPLVASHIQHIPVRVAPESRNAMIEAVAKHRIDVVVCWSLWPETFCFVTHEALAGGAFVIARRAAGNVWPAIVMNAPTQGCAIEDEDALFALFETGKLQVFDIARSRGTLIPGGLTSDLLLWKRMHETGTVVSDECNRQ
jgi:hypothetical protein